MLFKLSNSFLVMPIML